MTEGLSPSSIEILRQLCGELYLLRRKKDYVSADELKHIIEDCGLSVRYNKDHVAIYHWDPISPIVFTKRAGS